MMVQIANMRSAYRLLQLLACLFSVVLLELCKRSGAASNDSFAIYVKHQVAGTQPYARGANSKQMSYFIGRGSRAVPYTFTVNTGSAVLMVTCRSPAAQANCGSLPGSQNYVLSAPQTITDSQSCADTGLNGDSGCLLPSSKNCFVSAPAPGTPGTYNIYNGVLAQDTITIRNVVIGGPLTFQGKFGCAHSFTRCSYQSCYDTTTSCPTDYSGVLPMARGTCPGSGNGITAGWSFNVVGASAAPSALSVPEQVYRAGLIKQRITGFCYMQPQKDVACRSRNRANSAVVLGPAVPLQISSDNSTSLLHSAPLVASVYPKQAQGTAIPYTNTLQSLVEKVTVPVFRKPNVTNTEWSAGFKGFSVLWDAGSDGLTVVPDSVYAAFVDYWNQARSAAATSRVMVDSNFRVEKCPSPADVCGGNVPAADHACWQISLLSYPNEITRDVINKAKSVLRAVYPSAIKITLQGGAVAELPTVFDVNLCSGVDNTDTDGVAVCSYIQSAPSNDPKFVLSAPWFTGRFVQFDLTGPAANYPDSVGTINWSDPLASCWF